jgi:hypothetical protein
MDADFVDGKCGRENEDGDHEHHGHEDRDLLPTFVRITRGWERRFHNGSLSHVHVDSS